MLQQPGSLARPALISVSFLLLYALLDSAAMLFETFPRVSLCYLPAGLGLGLVLIFGAPYALLITIAQLLTDLWVRPLPIAIGDTVIYAFAVGATYFGAATLLTRLLGRTARVQSRPALALFLLGGVLTSVCFSLVSIFDLWATGILEWRELSLALTHAAIGSLLGIFSVTPFFILVIAPRLERVLEGISEDLSDERTESRGKENNRLEWMGVGGGFALLGLVITLVVTLNIDDQFMILCLLMPPFLAIALIAGLEVFAAAAFGAVLSSSVMQWDLQFQLQQTVEYQALLLLIILNGMLIGTIVSEKKLMQGTDTFREKVLDSVSLAAQRLAGVDNWKSYFTEVLRSFGEASRSTCVCLFEAWQVKDEFTFELLPYDWASPKYSFDREKLAILNRLRSRELTQRIEKLGAGEVWRDPPDSSTQEERAVWTASGIRFTLVVPLRVEHDLWACLLLGRTENQQDWTRREIETIRHAVRSLGSLLASARTAEQIQQLSENIRGSLWISSPDGRRRIGLNSHSEPAAGKDVKRLPDSWMDTVHPQDVSKVESALSGRRDFDLEYRIVLADKSIHWVRDRGFVARNEAGQISRIIGMAEDVTAQKSVEERLEQSVDLLAALFDKMGSGILVEDAEMRISHVNKEFFELLEIDEPSENVAGTSSTQLFSKAKVSGRRIESIRSAGIPIVDDELQLNGSSLNVSYVPISISRMRRYHLWQFRRPAAEEKVAESENFEEVLTAKDELLRETYQAVKNDLKVIYGLLKLQSKIVRDEKARSHFAADQTRVMAIALVHERLSKAQELGFIDFPAYAKNLTDRLVQAYLSDSQDVRIKYDVASMPLKIGTAIPCGLILNELVTNSLRFAFPDNRQGEILIRFGRLDAENLRLTVSDNGVGLPKGLDFKKTSTLGLMLVTGLTEQLGGTIDHRNHNGTEFDVSFPSNGRLPAQTSMPPQVSVQPSHQTQTVS